LFRRLTWLCISLLAIACARSATQSRPAPQGSLAAATFDSIRLERTRCYGTCPAYLLQLDRHGRVLFASRNPGDSARSARDSIGPEGPLSLYREAERIGFFTLPDKLEGTLFCADWATDHPTVTVTFFRREGAKRVVDYHGCSESFDHSVRPVVAQLRKFEGMIDAMAGSHRWVRPAPRR
jgi:hypothetical protein